MDHVTLHNMCVQKYEFAPSVQVHPTSKHVGGLGHGASPVCAALETVQFVLFLRVIVPPRLPLLQTDGQS